MWLKWHWCAPSYLGIKWLATNLYKHAFTITLCISVTIPNPRTTRSSSLSLSIATIYTLIIHIINVYKSAQIWWSRYFKSKLERFARQGYYPSSQRGIKMSRSPFNNPLTILACPWCDDHTWISQLWKRSTSRWVLKAILCTRRRAVRELNGLSFLVILVGNPKPYWREIHITFTSSCSRDIIM